MVPPAGARDVLIEHGLTDAGASAVMQCAPRLLRQTRATEHEFGVLLDADSGVQYETTLEGTRTELPIGAFVPRLRGQRGPGEYVFVHTHPSDRSFNAQDAIMLFVFARVRALVALGARGTWYLLSRTGPLPSSDRMTAACRDYLAEHQPGAMLRVAQGQTSRVAAERVLLHDLWTANKDDLCLRYNRVQHEAL